MPAIQQGPNLGDLLKYEAPQFYSRDVVTVPQGTALVLGSVVGRVAQSGHVKPFDPAATDGTEKVAGIAIQAVDAGLIERRDGLIVARHAVVSDRALVWPAAITDSERADAVEQLKTLGVLVRQGA